MRLKIYMLLIIVAVCCATCNLKSNNNPDDNDAATLTEKGWDTYFENKEYQPALDSFKDAINADQEYAEAYNGAGWASARLSSLDEAIAYFEQCTQLDDALVDAHAGLAFAYYANMRYTDAIATAKTALQTSANWNFSHDSTLDWNDLHLVLAACHFANGEYSLSLTEVRILNSSFDANIGTMEGKAALAEEIERLRSVV